MAGNLVVRNLAPITNAFSRLKNSLYSAPQHRIAGINDSLWPNPLQPVSPIQPPGAEPLAFNFNWGQNLDFTPRANLLYSAADLRALATYPLARICIENTKDVLTRLPWKVQLKGHRGEDAKAREARGKKDENIKKLNRFFERPNSEDDFPDFIRKVVEDMLVIDAASIFLGRDINKEIVELHPVDGSTITRLVEAHGWTPPPPSIAYQQNWEGYPRVDLTTDQLCYKPRNIVPRGSPWTYLYGYSPVEQIAQEISIGQARLNYIMNFYSEGTIPGGMIFAPVNTPPDKIKEAQQWIDSDLVGNLAKRRRIQIFQGFQQEGRKEQVVFPKEPTLADVFDDIHTRRVCFAFGTSPQRLMKSMNRASGESVQTASEEEGIIPFAKWIKNTIDYIIQVKMNKPEYEFTFDPFMELDKLKQAMADSEDVKNGLYTVNEKRRARGDEPSEEPAADELAITTSMGRVGIGEKVQKPGGITGGGGQTPGGAQPKAKHSVTATRGATSSTAGKSNGHSTFATCELHKNGYPRTFCQDCINSEMRKFQEFIDNHVTA